MGRETEWIVFEQGRMFRRSRFRLNPFTFLLVCLVQATAILAEPLAVRYIEGETHGFLVLRTMDGKRLADGDLRQFVKGDRVTSQVSFQFKDGSLYEDTAVFTQRREFQLVTDHLVQKGPSFKEAMDMFTDVPKYQGNGSLDAHGKTKEASQQMELPSDLANGMVFTLLKNIEPTPHPTTLSMVVGTPKPRIVKLEITPVDEEPFLVGDSKRKALHYDVHVKIEGVVGLAAQAARKQPPDTHAWILHDEAPVMVGQKVHCMKTGLSGGSN
jgi:hypothetical protein